MAKLYTFGKLGPVLTFKAKEGDLSIQKIRTVGGNIPGPVFTAPIEVGTYVKLVGDMEVGPCTKTDTECIGIVVDDPEFKGQQPTTAAAYGAYEQRQCGVELFGKAVRMVLLEAANTEVDFGNSVKFGTTTDQRFDKAAALNTTRVLSGAAASSGAKIPVLFGFFGALPAGT